MQKFLPSVNSTNPSLLLRAWSYVTEFAVRSPQDDTNLRTLGRFRISLHLDANNVKLDSRSRKGGAVTTTTVCGNHVMQIGSMLLLGPYAEGIAAISRWLRPDRIGLTPPVSGHVPVFDPVGIAARSSR